MNFEYYIANKISSGKSDDYARPVVRISYISIALGLALMIISVAVVIGFKHSISSKIIGFASHLQIVPFDNNESFEQHPLDVSGDYIQNLKNNPAIAHYQFSAHKAGVLKTNDQIQSVVLKGVGADFDQTFFNEIMVAGKFPAVDSSEKTDEVLISKLMADKLNLKTGDDVRVWFVSSLDAAARGRKFFISGIFNTSIEEFDNVFLVGDIRH
ncbi:MAG TPA: ABC transporter permease, partial [Bacteroidales bacterium]